MNGNLPPGMSRRDMDHVDGVVRCENCGADITRALEDEPEDSECVCPGGCWEPDYDEMLERRQEARRERMEGSEW